MWLKRSGYKTLKNKMSNNKTPQKTKHPRFQNVQSYETSKVTKCPKLQYVQSYRMSKVTKCPKLQFVQSYKMSKVTICSKLQNVQNYKIFLKCQSNTMFNYYLKTSILNKKD